MSLTSQDNCTAYGRLQNKIFLSLLCNGPWKSYEWLENVRWACEWIPANRIGPSLLSVAVLDTIIKTRSWEGRLHLVCLYQRKSRQEPTGRTEAETLPRRKVAYLLTFLSSPDQLHSTHAVVPGGCPMSYNHNTFWFPLQMGLKLHQWPSSL